jgi:molecular chaperone GrpE
VSKIRGISLSVTDSAAMERVWGEMGVTRAAEGTHLAVRGAAFDTNKGRGEVRVPVRVQHKETLPQKVEGESPARESHEGQPEVHRQRREQTPPEGRAALGQSDDNDEWRDRALRLQAEMENFRKRQQRLAEARVAEERERLIAQFATIADDLERALEAGSANVASLREGVSLTHKALIRLLAREGAEPIRPKGEMFDPEWHEAVSTVPYTAVGVRPNTVVNVIRDGYRIGDRLVRPARVVVAV